MKTFPSLKRNVESIPILEKVGLGLPVDGWRCCSMHLDDNCTDRYDPANCVIVTFFASAHFELVVKIFFLEVYEGRAMQVWQNKQFLVANERCRIVVMLYNPFFKTMLYECAYYF